MPLFRATSRVDANGLHSVALPGQITVGETGVSRAIPQPSLEHLRRSLQLYHITEICGHRGTACAGMRSPIIRATLMCGLQRIAAERLGERASQPCAKDLVLVRRQSDEIGCD